MLNRFLDRFFKSRERGARIDPVSCWQLSPPADSQSFVRALLDLAPVGSVLALESSSMAPAAAEALAPHQIEPTLAIQRGTLFPRPRLAHLPLDSNTVQVVAELLGRLASPEVCDHLYVYRASELLLEWHDAFTDNPLLASSALPESSVRVFSDRLGIEVRKGAV